MSAQAINALVNLVTLAVLGRLLNPAEFGLFGLVLAVQAIIKPLQDMGMQPAYIKLKEANKGASNAFFTINILIGVLGSILMVAAAPWAARFYHSAQLQELLPVFALSFFLAAASGQPVALQSRNKRFDRIALVDSSVLVIGAVVAVVLAWLGYGVWALIWRSIVGDSLRLIIYLNLAGTRYRVVGYRSIKPYLEDVGFGVGIAISRLCSGWVNELDKLILGKFSSIGEFGAYTRSQQIALMPNANIRTAITTPALSYLARQSDNNKIGTYLFLFWIVFALAGTPCLFLVTYGDLLLPLILGKQWIEFGWILQWMGLFGLARVFQGFLAIYHIDRKSVSRTNIYLLFSILGVLTLPVIFLFITGSRFYFIVAFGAMSLCYWIMAVNHALMRDWPDEAQKIRVALSKIVSVIIITLIVSFYMKGTLYMNTLDESIAVGISLQLALVSLLFSALYKKELWRLWGYVKTHENTTGSML